MLGVSTYCIQLFCCFLCRPCCPRVGRYCSSLNAAAGCFSGVPRARECLLWATLHGRTPGVLGSGLVLKFSKVMENASFILSSWFCFTGVFVVPLRRERYAPCAY